MAKKRILWVSEASFLNTGFSVLSMEILKRLHATGKYEIAEFGSYAGTGDPRASKLPWKFYGALPDKNDHESINRYNSSQYGQFGEALFEKVCLDFRPDIVVDSRDHWMCEFQLRSPYRNNFKLIWMPTVDGEPQRSEWLDSYQRADKILTYSQYGKDVLDREAPGKIKVEGIVRPGVDHEVYKPMDKKAIRQKFGIDEDAKIIMTVMRNQRRKLYPDLMEMFGEYLKHCISKGNEDLAKNSYLYLHTSYPDVGFDLSKYIMQYGIGHRVLCTYFCEACKNFYPSFFQTEIAFCQVCRRKAAHMPNTGSGVDREGLAQIMNLADLYIQYSICEGLGMPVAEAKACGVPAMGIDYSATSEQVNVDGCWPIKVAKFFHEPVTETEQRRALPDTMDAVKKVYNFMSLSDQAKEAYGKLARKDAAENYSFDRAAKIFEETIDATEIHDPATTWYNPKANIINKPQQLPQFTGPSNMIDWCLDNFIKRPELKTSFWRNELIKGLNTGVFLGRNGRENFNVESALRMFDNLVDNQNHWESARIATLVSPQIQTAKPKWELV